MGWAAGLGVLALAGLQGLGACGEAKHDPPSVQVGPPSTEAPAVAASVGDTSVPPAQAVLPTQASPPTSSPPGTRNQKSMTRADESTAMPMAGQANDHSAPLPPARRASAP